MQGFRFKTANSPIYCINADNSYQACHVFVQELKTLGIKETIHTLGYGRKHNGDTYIIADMYIPEQQNRLPQTL